MAANIILGSEILLYSICLENTYSVYKKAQKSDREKGSPKSLLVPTIWEKFPQYLHYIEYRYQAIISIINDWKPHYTIW